MQQANSRVAAAAESAAIDELSAQVTSSKTFPVPSRRRRQLQDCSRLAKRKLKLQQQHQPNSRATIHRDASLESNPSQDHCDRLASQPNAPTRAQGVGGRSRLLPVNDKLNVNDVNSDTSRHRIVTRPNKTNTHNCRRPSRQTLKLILLLAVGSLACAVMLVLCVGDQEARASSQRRFVAATMEQHDAHANCPHRGANSHKSQQQQQQQHHHHHRHSRHHHHYSQVDSSSSSSTRPDERFHYQSPSDEAEQQQFQAAARSESQRTFGGPQRLDSAADRTFTSAPSNHQQQQQQHNNYEADDSQQPPACADCHRLAIPLVTLVGDRQINGFIIPPANYQNGPKHAPAHDSKAAYHRRRNQPAAAAGYGHYGSYGEGVSLTEPKSDEKCPMTGPLTVCDHIGSYPTDLILDKLNSAKKRLAETPFNLDSFFSDERENSGDPFEKSRPKQQKHETNATRGRISEYPSANICSHQTQHKQQKPRQQKQHQPARDTKGYSSSSSSSAAVWPLTTTQAEIRLPSSTFDETAGPQDDFVELVERQAISLAAAAAAAQPDETSYPVSVERRQPGTTKSQRSTLATDDRMPAAARGRPSLGVAEPLLARSADRRTPKTISKTSTSTTRQRSSLREHSSADAESARHDSRRLAAGSSWLEVNSTQTFGGPEAAYSNVGRGLSTLKRPQAKRPNEEPATKTRRSRRQAASVSVTASAGTRTDTGDESDTNSADRDNNNNNSNDQPGPSDSAGGTQAEPICRARSIYISPRAALNDKKQWKYVVNAPERNPQIRQIIRVDICQNPFGPCSDQVSIPFGFTSECKQKYSKKKLLALDTKSGLLEVDTFFIPSCCVCQLIRTEDSTAAAVPPLPNVLPADVDTNLPTTLTTPASSQPGEDDVGASGGSGGE